MSLIILFISGFFWGVFDLIRKLALEFLSLTQIIYIIFFSQLIIFFLSLFLSKLIITSFYYIPFLISISFLNLISLYFFLKALKISEISMSIPLLSYSPLFSLLFSKMLLGESLSFIQYVGIVVIFFGSFILYSESLKYKDLLVSPFSLIKNKGARLILVVTVIWSIVPVLDKKSFYYTDIYLHGFLQSLLGFILLSLLIRFRDKNKIYKTKSRRNNTILFLLIVVSFLATVTQFMALKINLVPILEVVKRALGILLSLFFGYIFFKEKINIQKIFSIIIIISGLSIIL
ncbi:MAG: hypothetical protein CFH34_01177 [Alphaproteobacteria bacterium MarineAlpha9_Bin4]|nr:hypothetical protein [Pelagibacterales bacterium]PPR26005.1 MAG: hypothetical protein CFH34_01177 [Alphaproteobacteria bacterium MarineAlpha9_Bin4]|tara:strand:- start:1483 stop:2349 length:867 start_codon:yes stop_codon:yes gene_type:complete